MLHSLFVPSFDDLASLQLDAAALGDLELYLNGAYWPQPRFLLRPPQPMGPGEKLLLRDANNVRVAVFTAVKETSMGIAGDLEIIEVPRHADFQQYRQRAEPFRTALGPGAFGVALRDFPTIELEEELRAAGRPVAIHVIEPGPVDHFARVRAAEILVASLGGTAAIQMQPFAHDDPSLLERILRNYGATRVIEARGERYRPEIAALMEAASPPPERQGFCVWFTGLPSSGKSTIADQLAILLRQRGRRLTLLDGDVVRTHLSKGLGFTREDRDVNIRRIGWVAAEIARHGGASIVAAVSPYAASRDDARRMVGPNFVLVHVATPAELCEDRDVKGFYKQARAGRITGFTGVDDPYEIPANAELTLPTADRTPEQNAVVVLEHLVSRGWLA